MSPVQKALAFALVSALIPVSAYALSITSGPIFTPSTNAPLAGALELTTDESSRVSVTASDGTEMWERSFYEYSTSHSIPLAGFKTDRTYQITVTVHSPSGETSTAPNPVEFTTPPLPADFPTFNLLKSVPEKMEPGYTIFVPQQNNGAINYITIINENAEVVWYMRLGYRSPDIRQLPNGDFFYFNGPGNSNPMIYQMNILGEIVRSWSSDNSIHHEAFPTDHGTILFCSDATRVVTNYPSSATDPSAPPLETANVDDNPVIEMSYETGEVLNNWSTLDLLDPRRVGYLSFGRNGFGFDWSHSNGVIEDPRDRCIIESLRHQNAVIKFSRDGQLKWILGPHEGWGPEFQQYLLTPVGTPFAWQYGQHAPALTPQGTLLVFDNGNDRAMPFDPPVADADNYSRAVEYKINEETMEVSQVWEFNEPGERIFSASRGDADWLPKTGNVLITYADVQYVNGARPNPLAPNATMARITETTHYQPGVEDPALNPPEVVFDMTVIDLSNTNASYRGNSAYRSERIPDFYAVITPAQRLNSLLTTVEAADAHKGESLLATLRAALASIERCNSTSAINQLRAFQHKAAAQVARADPALAEQWTLLAQSIIDALDDGSDSCVAAKHQKKGRLHAQISNGKAHLQFSGDRARNYVVEASSDLVHWKRIGTAHHKGNGRFEFSDDSGGDLSPRLYRIVGE